MGGRFTRYGIEIGDDGTIVSTLEGVLNEPHCVPSAVASWGSTLQIVGKDKHEFKLKECGSLNFGLRLSKAINLAYDSIGYLPPHGLKNIPERSLSEMIEETKILASILNEMQEDSEAFFPTRHSFGGNEGKIYSRTVGCLNDTINDWELL